MLKRSGQDLSGADLDPEADPDPSVDVHPPTEVDCRNSPDGDEGLGSSEVPDAHDHLDDLTARARAGDPAATSRVIEYLIAETRPMAFHLARGVMDPEDLQADAIESLLRLWQRQEGPSRGAAGYLIRSMRNRFIDELRSPRSRTDNFDADLEITDLDSSFENVDLHKEFEWVRRAMQRLSDDHQYLLKEIHVAGRKPADVARDLGRSPDGMYSLHRRAKIALKRALLIEVLMEEGAPDPCVDAVRDLPQRVADTPETTAWKGGEPRHFETCQRCRKQWSKFGAIGSVLSVGGLVTLGATLFEAHPAAAMVWQVPGVTASKPEAPASGNVPETAGTRKHVIVASSVAAGLAFGIPGGYVACNTNHEEVRADPPGTLVVTLTQEQLLRFEYELDIRDDEWRQDDFVLSYPAGLQFVAASSDMECVDTGQDIRCSDPGVRPVQGSLEFAGSALSSDEVGVTVTASTETHTFHGSASAAMPAPSHAVSTRADVR